MKYVWPIISNVITLLIVWGIFAQLSYDDSFQTVAALVVIAYANLLTQSIVSTRMTLGSNLVLFEYLARIFKNQGDIDTSEEISTDVKQLTEQVKKKNAEFYINMASVFIIWATCVIVILGNL